MVDLHAITNSQDGQQLRQRKRETLAALLATGLDPTKSVLFYQSSVSVAFEGSASAQITDDGLEVYLSRFLHIQN